MACSSWPLDEQRTVPPLVPEARALAATWVATALAESPAGATREMTVRVTTWVSAWGAPVAPVPQST
jgi:hypothetical protein